MADQFTCPKCNYLIRCSCNSMECDLDDYITKHMETHNE